MNNSINRYKKEYIPTVSILLFSLATLGYMYFPTETPTYLFSMLMMAGVSGLSIIYTILMNLNIDELQKKDRLNLLLLTITTMLIFFPSLHNENLDFIQRFVQPFMYVGIGMLLLNFRMNPKILELNFLIHSIFFISHFPEGAGVSIFHSTSRNYHSIIIIISALLVYIAWYQMNKKIKLYPAVLTLIISIWSYGRSGILTAFILFLVIFMYKLHQKDSRIRYLVYLLTFFIGILALYVIFNVPGDTILHDMLGGFADRGFFDSARSRIINEYFSEMLASINNLLFGVNLEGNEIFNHYGYNLHNSYLRLHSLYGLPGVFIFIYLLINAFIKYWPEDKLYLGLLFVALLRISTDIAAFFGSFDPLLMYLLLKPFLMERSYYPNNLSINKIDSRYINYERSHILGR